MQRTITFVVRLVTIIVIVADHCSCYSSEDRSLNRSVVSQIAVNTDEKRNESLTTPPQNTEKKNDSLTASSQNTGKKNESLSKPPQNGTVDTFECRRKPCVRKCCADGQVFRYRINVYDIECVVPFDNETYSFADRLKRLIFSPETNESSSFVGIEYGKRCEGFDFLNYQNDKFTLLNGGSQVDFQTDTLKGSTGNFCMEFIANENRFVPLLCPITVIEHHQVHPLYPITLSISALFMMATVFVLHSVGKLKTLSGKIQACHVISLMIGYFFLIPTQIFHFYETCRPFCFVAAIGVQFFILAGFCWLNVICFHNWVLFSNKCVNRESQKHEARKQFIHYSTYAWGCPTVITSITLLAEFWTTMSLIFRHPQLSVNTCGFGDKVSARFYFYGPMGIVLLLNIVIFWAVFSKINKDQRSTSRVLSSTTESQRHSSVQKSRFAMCIRLFVVMGVCWIMEVVSALVGGSEHIWYATDICNSMQGVAIFFITICSHQTWHSFRKSFGRSSSNRQTTKTIVKGT